MSDQRQKRKILVTSALPYANGPLHMGHLVEYIQTDIWARFQKQRGHTCTYVCADDAHGTAISLHAEKQSMTPEESVALINKERIRDFGEFHIEFDNYYSTHSDENRVLSESIYKALRDKGHIATRNIIQAYDPEKQMFLADRYIKGECPKCGAPDQYGDNCEKCGATYTPAELKKRLFHDFRRQAGRQGIRTLFLQADRLPGFSERLDPQRHHRARDRQQAGRMVGRWPAGLGHLPRCPLLRFRDS